MPSDPTATALRDIQHHIDLATEFARNLDMAAFQTDLRTVYAANIYRHDYEDVAAQLVWNTVHRALPQLKIVVDAEPGHE